jgi:8-oxo-dGTP pyrophosphatase MutT (NUDIX family)
VFPGGRVDPGDELRSHPAVHGGERSARTLGIDGGEAIAYLVAGVRETFEECGIWLGTNTPPAAVRSALAHNQTTLADVLQQHDASIDLDRLIPWARWITPVVEARRFDTRFFAARADGLTGVHDDHETVDSGWFRAADVLQEPARFTLAPPTWWTLRELAAFRTVDDVLEAARTRDHRPIQPVIETTAAGMRLLLPGHDQHPDPPIPGLPTEVIFEHGKWVALAGTARLAALP